MTDHYGGMTTHLLETRLDELLDLRNKVDREIRKVALAIETGPARKRRSRHEIPECGTESGYQRHYARGEKCDDCKRAHALHTSRSARRRRLLKSGAS